MTYHKTLAMGAAVTITAAGLVAITNPAFAKNRTAVVNAEVNQVTRRVGYADLNLASARGETVLNRRVGGAVDEVCDEATGGHDGTLRLESR